MHSELNNRMYPKLSISYLPWHCSWLFYSFETRNYLYNENSNIYLPYYIPCSLERKFIISWKFFLDKSLKIILPKHFSSCSSWKKWIKNPLGKWQTLSFTDFLENSQWSTLDANSITQLIRMMNDVKLQSRSWKCNKKSIYLSAFFPLHI